MKEHDQHSSIHVMKFPKLNQNSIFSRMHTTNLTNHQISNSQPCTQTSYVTQELEVKKIVHTEDTEISTIAHSVLGSAAGRLTAFSDLLGPPRLVSLLDRGLSPPAVFGKILCLSTLDGGNHASSRGQ